MKRMSRRISIVAVIAVTLVLVTNVGAWALDPSVDINTKLNIPNTSLGLNNLWIIIGAVRHRVPPLIIFRMTLNVAIDLFFGSVPIAGDVFDFLFDENLKNMRLLEKHRNRARAPRTKGEMVGVAFLVGGGIFLMSLLIIGSMLALIIWLIGQRF